MSADRTPEERQHQDALDARVLAAIETAVDNCALCIVADQLDLDADVCEAWTDRVYDELRAELSREDLIRAVILLVEPRAGDQAHWLTRTPDPAQDLAPGPWSAPCTCPRCRHLNPWETPS